MASFKYAQNINHGRTGSSPSSNSAKENSLPGTKLETNETGQASSIEQHKKRTSPGKALFMLLKAFVGTGVTFLPGAFASGGLVFSIILMVVIALICLVAFQILISSQQHVLNQHLQKNVITEHESVDYGYMGQALYGPWLRYIIQAFLCISQMGFVSAYLIFISQNIGLAIDSLSNCTSPIDSKYYIWIVLLMIVPITWVRCIDRFSIIVVMADVLILFGLICILYFTSSQIAAYGPGPNIKTINVNDFALMIGTAVFSYEGIGMVIPIVEGMANPSRFPTVMNVAMTIVTVIFVLIGAMGYVAFGDQTFASVVANLPHVPLSTAVRLIYSVAIILTAPFMLYPALEIVEERVFGGNRFRPGTQWMLIKSLVRSLLAVVCAVVSFGVGHDGLDKFVALVGSLACMPLCFVFPGMFHCKVTESKWKRVGDISLILWGFAIMIYTVYINISSWIYPSLHVRQTPGVCSV